MKRLINLIQYKMKFDKIKIQLVVYLYFCGISNYHFLIKILKNIEISYLCYINIITFTIPNCSIYL